MAERDFAAFCRSIGVSYSGPVPRNTPRSVRQGIREWQRANSESERFEPPSDANHRLPHVPAGFRGVNLRDPRLGPARPRATAAARERARNLVFPWCAAWREFRELREQLAPLDTFDRSLGRDGVFRHPVPGNDARGPLCKGFPVCPWCRLYMLRQQLGSRFGWNVKQKGSE